MDLESVKNHIGVNEVSYGNISASELVSICSHVHVGLEIDKGSLDYFYEIDVEEILESDITTEDLALMQSQGWAFNENKTKIILFLKT